MRIAEVISGLGLGGAEWALAQRLEFAPSNFETHVVLTSRHDSYLSAQVAQRSIVHPHPLVVTRRIFDLKPDLILTHNPREALRLLSHPTLFQRFTVGVVAHNEITSENWAKAKLLDNLLPRVNSRAAFHVAVSTRAALGPQCDRGRDVRVCLLGGRRSQNVAVDASAWPPKTKKRVLVLGRMSPQKNLRNLIEAIQGTQGTLRSHGVHVALVGSGELSHQLARRITHYRLDDVASIEPWTPDPESVLAAADTLLITSLHEGGPLTLFEGLLLGTRVVSTPVGASIDLRDYDFGPHILSDGGVKSLERGLIHIAQHSPLSQVERESRQKVFSFLKSRESAARFYTTILEHSSR